jgi:predicted DCC family thiol-disulfide oxidoreductase YuxK
LFFCFCEGLLRILLSAFLLLFLSHIVSSFFVRCYVFRPLSIIWNANKLLFNTTKSTTVNLALDWDPQGRLRFAALQSNVGRALLQANGRDASDISSIVLVTKDGAYTKSDAVLRITEELLPLKGILPIKPAAVLGRVVIPKFVRDLIYDGVANNRYQILGQRNECRFDADGEFEDRFVDDSMALLWNTIQESCWMESDNCPTDTRMYTGICCIIDINVK